MAFAKDINIFCGGSHAETMNIRNKKIPFAGPAKHPGY
jgi:hypothetical protein